MENNKPTGQPGSPNPINQQNQPNTSGIMSQKPLQSTPMSTPMATSTPAPIPPKAPVMPTPAPTPKPVEKPKEYKQNHKPLYSMNARDNKNNWIIIAFAVLVLAAFAIFSFKQPKSTTTSNPSPTPTLQTDNTPSSLGASAASALSYDNALSAYTGKSILFDGECNATPSSLNVALNTRVLIANDSDNKTLVLQAPGRGATLAPHHYMASTLKNIGEFGVSCNGKSTGTIVVEDAPHA